MIPDEIKQSIIDIVHQEAWKTASLATGGILFIGLSIVFMAKNGILSWIQGAVNLGFQKQIIEHTKDLERKATDYQEKINNKFEIFKTVTSQIQDRRTRSNEKEYDACIETWTKLQDTYEKASIVVNKDKNTRNFKKCETKIQKVTFLKKIGLSSEEIDKIINDENPLLELFNIASAGYIQDAEKNLHSSKKTLMKNSIFFTQKIYKECSDFHNIIHEIIEEEFSSFYSIQKEPGPSSQTLLYNAYEKLEEIMNILRSSLYIRAIDITDEFKSDALKPSPAPQPSPSGNTPEPEPTAPK